MVELISSASSIQSFVVRNEWPFCFIGGIAVIRWGEPRFTQDVDLTVYTGFQNEERIIDAFLGSFEHRFEDMRTFALERRVLLLQTPQGFPFDVSLGGLPFEERLMERSTQFAYLPDASLRTCSAEDLVVMKAFAGRDIDWLDVKGVLIKQQTGLDWALIMRELEPLAEWKEDPSILPKLHEIRDSVAA